MLLFLRPFHNVTAFTNHFYGTYPVNFITVHPLTMLKEGFLNIHPKNILSFEHMFFIYDTDL
jgi:hypothetical protein